MATEQELMAAFAERDLWKEARDRSANYQGAWFVRLLSAILRFLFPKKFAHPMVFTFGVAGTRLMCVDLNKYRPDVNVEMLIDQGVRLFMLRVGGPAAWIYPTTFVMDQTFVPYYERIRAYAKAKGITVWIVGYGVHDYWKNEEGNYLGIDPQVTWLKEATRNHNCDMYAWDDEVSVIWKNGRETGITQTNAIKSISICMEQTYQEMERSPLGPAYHKMPIHYSANWHMKKVGLGEYQAWLDRSNKDVNTRHFLTWRAWLPNIFSELFALIGELFDRVITPTGLQENAFLRMGSELAADLWQFTFSAKGPWCGPQSQAGIDASVGYGPSLTIQEFAYNANLSLAQTPPEEPPEEPPTGELAEQVAANTADILLLKAWREDMREANQ